MRQSCTLKKIAAATALVGGLVAASVLAGSGRGLQNCCFSYPPPDIVNPHGVAEGCLDHPCNEGEVCSGTGGLLPDGRPWAEAECVRKPPQDGGPPSGTN